MPRFKSVQSVFMIVCVIEKICEHVDKIKQLIDAN
jgi:hypothetical protein